MAIISRPLKLEDDNKWDATFGPCVYTECPTCHRRVRVKMSKEDFEQHKSVEYACPFCSCTHTF